jgi:hypothetical protein
MNRSASMRHSFVAYFKRNVQSCPTVYPAFLDSDRFFLDNDLHFLENARPMLCGV